MKRLFTWLLVIALLALSAPALFAQDANVDVYGRPLPEDAAPYEQQVWQELCNSGRSEISLMSAVSVYQRICELHGFDKFGDSLVVLDENLNLIPAAAESWEVLEDGVTWRFYLRPDQVWSDGTPLTAEDYAASYRFMVDPANAYDFVWMWQGWVEGWSEAAAGEIPVEEVGIRAVDDLTFEVTATGVYAFLPSMFYFWPPMQAAALAEFGPSYLLDPATSVSSGPFILSEFVPGERLVLTANPTYNGYRPPLLREIRGIYGDMLNGSFLAFQNYDVDRVNYTTISPADFEIINSDPQLNDNYLPNSGDFRTDYLFFDTFTAPFDDVNVRLAFAKALDREAIVENVIGARLAVPAYSFLAPGFPAADTAGNLRDIQAFDCAAAQQLLADAGYPGGEGFPAQELKLRGESEAIQAWFVAAAASISQCLGVEITVNNLEFSTYMSQLLARPTGIAFGAVSYGMDYLDPSNMLGVFVSTGRHSWRSAEYDSLIEAAASEGDPEMRTQLYQDAERNLVDEASAV